MRRKLNAQSAQPNLYYRAADGVLSVPGYTFDKALPWKDTGSMTLLAEGSSLKDGSNVLAKIAPAQSNGSMCLERERHILERLASSGDGYSSALRLIGFFSILKESGDVVVLLVDHPGTNILGRYLPETRVNNLILTDLSFRRSPSPDVHMKDIMDDGKLPDDSCDIMDLASFLEFAIQATHCLEAAHKAGVFHREVRANAFHLSSHLGTVRFVHFGNRAVSLESLGSPSALVIGTFSEPEKLKVKEALCYLAPEQTGGIETISQDHRTDLYSLGILFWTLLVGHAQMPFEGEPLELLHAIVQKRPMPVHEVRRDVPQVLASIIDKLLSKSPDARYQSAHGLKADLLECQRRLLVTVSSVSEESSELIPSFSIAMHDRFQEFTMPLALFGRERELELIRNVVRNTATNFSRHFSASKGVIAISTSDSGTGDGDGEDASHSSKSDSPSSRSPTVAITLGSGHTGSSNDSLRVTALKSGPRISRAHVVIVQGPPGVGKSSIILANQSSWRSHGLWGQAKFQNTDSAPFAALLACLSSTLRQLMVFTDLHRFVERLKQKLGPQLQNIPLLYHGAPELKDILSPFGIIAAETPNDHLTEELRARFQALVENVFSVIAETRLFGLFLDDLHEADQSTLNLVSALVNSKSRMLIFITIRPDKGIIDRVEAMFNNRSRPTWITVEPLNYSAILSLVSKTLHRTKDQCASLARFVYATSSGNAFAARNVLTTLQRQHHITFDWENNYWLFDMSAIEQTLVDKNISDPTDITFLISHLRELPEEARKYLIWAAFFGETFKVTEVALVMDWEDSSGSSGSEDEDDMWNLHKAVSIIRERDASNARTSIQGLQMALVEGWLVQRARDMCSFTHDRYRQAAQAEAESLSPQAVSKMSFRIVLMLLHENPADVYRIAEHAKRCLPLLHEHSTREELLGVLIDAGEAAWERGAHELAFQSLSSARTLLRDDPWTDKPSLTFSLFSRLAALLTWQGDFAASHDIISECLEHALLPEQRASLLRLRSRNHWMCNNFFKALEDTLLALKLLGIEINPAPQNRDSAAMFEKVKNEILAVGFDEILSIPRTTDPRMELAVALLSDAGINAYWSPSIAYWSPSGPSPLAFADVIGLTTIQVALRSGMAPGSALGFFWCLGAAAETRELYRFSTDLGKLGLRIAERHGTNAERCRAQVLYSSMVAGFDSAHLRANIPRLEEAIKLGISAGDRIYTSFASIHCILIRFWCCEHLSDLIILAEECHNDVKLWTPSGDPIILAMGVLNIVRALGGYTDQRSVDTLFDTDNFSESEYLTAILARSGNGPLAMNWYNAFKVAALYCLGFVSEAAELGFSVYETRHLHPNHRHVRYGLFFHCLAMIACLRPAKFSEDQRARYLKQIDKNMGILKRWLSPSPVNNSTWVALVHAELASLHKNPSAMKLYDVAVKLAVQNDWLLEEGWALYLQGSHFVRTGVEGLGGELQRQGISRHAQWGAQGIVHALTSSPSTRRSQYPSKRAIFSCDVGVQTENIQRNRSDKISSGLETRSVALDEEESLSASDLASILKWSTDISSDINLSAALQRLTEISTEASGSQATVVVIAREGDYSVACSMIPPERCQVFEHHRSIMAIADPLQKAIIQHTLNSKQPCFHDDASLDSRFSSEARQSAHRSVVCLPIFSNRGQTFGAVYFASRYAFSKTTARILTLLCQQASISISNALLFRSVQAGTRENLRMISVQREALEIAKRSREDALKAAKIKSNFLASMSHELRTPFSSFYGLLDLLSGTTLNPGQSEIVQTAKQSCELLLKIIDSILDYSKLEASAVKLEPTGFLMENIIADCMELLLPMAAKKLDLSFNIEANVPPWIFADYARIRQVLMNLIGNSVKFTLSGSVQVICSLEAPISPISEEVHVKFVIKDTGVGLKKSEADNLFVPFQQADNSSTRRFGGTGLGLSISRQLVRLMGGAIGCTSNINIGAEFWFTIPVKIYSSEESQQYLMHIDSMKSALSKSRPLRVLVCSGSQVTLTFLGIVLDSFNVELFGSVQDVEARLRAFGPSSPPLDFLILDSQSETLAEELARLIVSLKQRSLSETKIIHMYTPTTSLHSVFANNTPGVVKMTKPPRKARLLQMLASLKELPNTITSTSTDVTKAIEDLATAQRTLFGNVLVAEDNPIAQNLLVKQLERFQLNVVATSNGVEAIEQWEAHDPGYFSVALFDHHMPICDGVTAAERLRLLETQRNCAVRLPIVALSADCQESTKQLCLSAGMNAFFSKPLKRSDLMTLLSMFGTPSPASISGSV
ncbi:dual-domain HisK/Mak2 protein kinase [Mycena floridula]|nr:dual-domain HisK/Mak2 protein kinase [Mycena floridula]